MILTTEGSTTLVVQEQPSLSNFLAALQQAYPGLKGNHIIVQLARFAPQTTADLLLFLELSGTHKALGRSFVVVSDSSYNQVPEALVVAPTLQEAKDVIALEDMTRDLGL